MQPPVAVKIEIFGNTVMGFKYTGVVFQRQYLGFCVWGKYPGVGFGPGRQTSDIAVLETAG